MSEPCQKELCPHGMEIERWDYESYRCAEEEAERTGQPVDHPLPPYCRCCGQPCMLGHTQCQPCEQEVA